MADSFEYRTVILHTEDLRLAVQSNLLSLGGALLATGLISANNESELRNLQHTEATRAARLVEFIQTKVRQNSRYFNTFLEVLRRDEIQYADILYTLNETLHSQRRCLNCAEPDSQTASARSVSLKQGPPTGTKDMQGYYRGELNHLLQTKRIEDLDYSIPEEKYDATIHKMKYKNTISLKHLPSGRKIQGISSAAELSKSAACEQAAKNAWSQIKNIERRMGIAEITSKDLATASDTPLSKVWKSKLVEHLAQNYKHGKIKISYNGDEHPNGGFKSTVTCGDIASAEGLGKNKGIAEHNAAYNALRRLKSK